MPRSLTSMDAGLLGGRDAAKRTGRARPLCGRTPLSAKRLINTVFLRGARLTPLYIMRSVMAKFRFPNLALEHNFQYCFCFIGRDTPTVPTPGTPHPQTCKRLSPIG